MSGPAMQDELDRDAEALRLRLDRFSAQAQCAALLRHLSALLLSVQDGERAAVAALLCKWLEEAGAGLPDQAGFGPLRDDAAFWADIATPRELEAYVGAGLRRMEETPFADASRKRLLVMLWETMSDADRRRFLSRVDPAGKFRSVA